jgi:peptidoglycan/xylan/chitin deacetylase (PgdA/CDA1 family)
MIHDDNLPDRVAARLSPHELAIFLIHGVIPSHTHPVRNYTRKHMEVSLFARCMKRLAQAGTALSMAEVLSYCERGEAFPPNAFALTFDDGFENNLSVAAPVLADLGIPAMVYITSGFIEANGMSWIDRIEYAVEEARAQTLRVDWTETLVRLEGADSRTAFLNAVRYHVKHTSGVKPDIFADELCARLGKPGRLTSDDPLDRKMTWRQVRDTSEGTLISFGGHSHTHPILSFLSPQDLAFELDTSLDLMRKNAGLTPTHYSYPEGLAHCFSDIVIAALKKRSVRCCPTAIEGTNQPGTDPFLLRRIMVA